MALSTEIVRTYRAPRAVIRRVLEAGPREDRAIAWLMGACAVIFVGQWPRLQREALLNPEGPPLDARIGAALFAWLFLAPLMFYGIAALSHLVARGFGGRGSWWSARAALFWSLLATSPLFLLQGIVSGVLGQGPEWTLASAVTALAFLWIWGVSLREAERPQGERA